MKPTISYNGNVSVSTVTNKLDVLSANEFMNFIKNKSGLEGADWEASDYYKNMGYWVHIMLMEHQLMELNIFC